jgi:hypothetical protein
LLGWEETHPAVKLDHRSQSCPHQLFTKKQRQGLDTTTKLDAAVKPIYSLDNTTNGEHTEFNPFNRPVPACYSFARIRFDVILASGPDLIDANHEQHPWVGVLGLCPEEDK